MKITYKNKRLNKFLKTTSIVLSSFVASGLIAAKTYDLHIDSKLEEVSYNEENIKKIKDFNKNNNACIFVMNDSQGINLNIGFWEKSYPEYLYEQLGIEVIDLSSLKYNKTSHIDIFLQNNISLAEFKELNNESTYVSIRNFALQNNIPTEELQNIIGYLGEKIFHQQVNDVDKNIYLSSQLEKCQRPIVIYSSGANDLMFLISANPATIKKYNENGNLTRAYRYAVDKLNDPNTIREVIANIENNFKNIYSINPNALIVSLSIYVPNQFRNDEYQEFKDAIVEYNLQLKNLCQQYNVCYVDEEELGQIYNQKNFNFHINEVGQKKLSSILIDTIATNLYNKGNSVFEYDDILYYTGGLEGVYHDLISETIGINYDTSNFNNYSYDIYLEQLQEKIDDANICKKLVR